MKKKDLQILMLEDDPLDAELNKTQLQLLDEYSCIVQWVTDKPTYLKALNSYIPDIILSDYNLPGYNGIEALNDLRARNLLVPFIFVTGTIDEETAAGTIKAGAWDYVVKDRLFRLPLAIRGALQLKDERINNAKVEEKNRQLSVAIEQSPVHIVITDINNKITYVNTRFTEVTGYTPEDVIGKDALLLIPKNWQANYFNSFNAINQASVSWRGETQSLRKDGSLFWEYNYISPLKNEKGETTQFIAIKEDITKRKQMEQELIEAKDKAERSDKLKEAFLQNLSHEIRTPLNAIVGFSELLGLNQIEASEQKEYISIIVNSSNQLLSIVNDILTVSRIQTGQEATIIKPMLVNSLMDNLFTIFKSQVESKSLKFILYKGNDDPAFSVLTDETKCTQIMSNLLNNAIKFTQRGKIEFGYMLSKKYVEFYVKDTGIGIPKESQGIIFERFRQVDTSISRTFGGTGLGLSISKAFAEMLNGTIRVESEPNQGSTFYLSIPRQEIDKKNEAQAPSITIANDAFTILVAEDEIYNYQLIEAYFYKTNYNILHANDGNEAVDCCIKNPNIDIVLMDIKMPNMDGIAAMKEIRKIRTNLPIVAQTAYALESEKQQLLDKGFDDYIAKPINKDELIQKVLKLLKVTTK